MIHHDGVCWAWPPARLRLRVALALQPFRIYQQPPVVAHHITVMLHMNFNRGLCHWICLLADRIQFTTSRCTYMLCGGEMHPTLSVAFQQASSAFVPGFPTTFRAIGYQQSKGTL